MPDSDKGKKKKDSKNLPSPVVKLKEPTCIHASSPLSKQERQIVKSLPLMKYSYLQYTNLAPTQADAKPTLRGLYTSNLTVHNPVCPGGGDPTRSVWQGRTHTHTHF